MKEELIKFCSWLLDGSHSFYDYSDEMIVDEYLKEYPDLIESKIMDRRRRFANVGIINGGLDTMKLRCAIEKLKNEGVVLVLRDNCIVDRNILESHLETLKSMDIPDFPKHEPFVLTKLPDISMPEYFPKDKVGHKRPYRFHK